MGNELEDLLRSREFDQALSRIRSGELDPASTPVGVYFASGHDDPELLECFLGVGADPNYASSPSPIEVAASKGLLDNVERLLTAGADPNTGGGFAGSTLMQAIGAGHDTVAARLVEGGARHDGRGESPLVHAVWRQLPRTVRAMLAAGFDLDGRATLDLGKLHQAEQAKSRLQGMGQGLADLLSQLGAAMETVDEEEEEGQPSLDSLGALASLGQQAEAMRDDQKARKEADDRIEAPRRLYDNAPSVVVAAGEGHKNLLELLATAGADLSAADDRGLTPWAAAEQSGHPELARWIEAVGGTREVELAPDAALAQAVERGDGEAAARALARGADPDGRDSRKKTAGRTPLLLAVHGDPETDQGHVDLVRQLLAAGADPDLRDRPEGETATGLFGESAGPDSFDIPGVRFGHTPLALAAVLGRVDCARALLTAGADPHSVDDLGWACVDQAVSNGEAEILALLLEAGVDPSHKGPDGPLLMQATGDGHAGCVLELLAVGADPNVTYHRETPLHQAAMVQDGESILALLEAGADPNRLNGEGQTALDLAKEYGDMGDHVRIFTQDGEQESAQLDEAVLERLASVTTAESKPRSEDDDEDWDEDDEEWDDEDEIPEVEIPELDDVLAAHYQYEAARARIAAALGGESYQAVVHELGDYCGAIPQPMEDDQGFSIHVHSASPLGQGDLDIEALQAQYLPRGAMVLGGGSIHHKGRLFVLPTTDPLEALAAVGAAGPNYDIAGSQVIELFRTHPAIITDIRYDTVVGRFEPIPEDLEKLAIELYSLCPDTIDQGVGSLPALIKSLEGGRFYLWWD